MFARLLRVVVCVAAAAFYLRFLIALWKEPERLPIGYWVRLRLTFATNEASEPQRRKNTLTRAA
jgi:hypothetical protein